MQLRLLDDIEFRDRARAHAELTQLSGTIARDILTRIQLLLAASADPDNALHHLLSLWQRQPDAFHRITTSDTALHFALTVFSYSRFLAEEVLQHPEWIEEVAGSPDLYRLLSAEEFSALLESSLGKTSQTPSPLILAVFRRRQILRILLRDVLAYATLSEATEELSNLADAILDVAYRHIRAGLVGRYGPPCSRDQHGAVRECGLSVIALGKLGGRELNYSSDIDLMFVYSAAGDTGGANTITNKEFFKKVANQLTDLLSTYTAEGSCYRVDLRLRPDGRLGEVCISLEGANAYYENRARDWELQMLIKARVAAGEPEPGRELLSFIEPKIYASTLNFSAVEAVSLTRERIHEKLIARRGGDSGLDVKLTRGGIRDIEFLVQCLQRLHGGREPWVRHGGTPLALRRLRDKDLLSSAEYARLASAYQFLRELEHRLQMVEDRQTHLLPSDAAELAVLARRMPAGQLGRTPSPEKLLAELNRHLEDVQAVYERVIHAQQPLYYTSMIRAPLDETPPPEPLPAPKVAASNLIRFLDQRAPLLAARISRSSLRGGFRAFEHFLEKVFQDPRQLHLLNENAVLAADAIELFENSPHFAEELVRHPELLEDLARIRDATAPDYHDFAAGIDQPAALRRFFKREMLRIQAASICLSTPIFTTLAQTSDLADAVVAAAYRMAVEQVRQSRPPQDSAYEPRDRMIVIALGRLGMREFDLGSDADLNFVLPDEDAPELRFWTRAAGRMIDIITAYTGEGVMFAVDTRLRPNGRAGPLVQLVGGYKDYFAKGAEAWEGISYMKSRAVAGNTESGTAFLHELQEVDWRRYGQSGRSRTDLRNMRARLENEQSSSNPLKAGAGGYYDIDFALMYLRLKSAGIFFKVLNTPERIDIIEKMGHLDRADAEFLRDGATFCRALDHALRVYSGHAEGKLPQAEAHLQVLANLVKRWTPEHLHDQPLPVELAQIQRRTREYFRRLFG
ncbi:MAG: glutamine-synthetase adenylyltransferase [Acidobacteria bacterium]|nr:glutamine-synthetase adenylyltransferase [Acidobacteriota bacterium]MBI3280097.1 glutamine-synthetase adenylyltransferase [Acidobacteriota bacterium]